MSRAVSHLKHLGECDQRGLFSGLLSLGELSLWDSFIMNPNPENDHLD